MRLADFIHNRAEVILQEWEWFAKTLLPAAEEMSSLELRDHAAQILQAIALDISTPQSAAEQLEKSMGRAPKVPGARETAAQTHAILRQKGGFDVNQLAAEYRALRASVLRLWTAHCSPEPINPDDVMRFNEAIDQALAESIKLFDEQVQRSRNLFLGMLGHDLRSPANAILFIAKHLSALNAGSEVSTAAASVIRCGESIKALLDDLWDFNRTELGVGIELRREDVDLAPLFTAEVDIQRRAHPGADIKLQVEGNTEGRWDGVRLQQVLRNLISNAVKYGAEGSPITVKLKGNVSTVDFEVSNLGRQSRCPLTRKSFTRCVAALPAITRHATSEVSALACLSFAKSSKDTAERSKCARLTAKRSSPLPCLAQRLGRSRENGDSSH